MISKYLFVVICSFAATTGFAQVEAPPRRNAEAAEGTTEGQPALPPLWDKMTRSGVTMNEEVARHAGKKDSVTATFADSDIPQEIITQKPKPNFMDGLDVINNGTDYAVVPLGSIIYVPSAFKELVGKKMGSLRPISLIFDQTKFEYLPLVELPNGDVALPPAAEIDKAKAKEKILITSLGGFASIPYIAPPLKK